MRLRVKLFIPLVSLGKKQLDEEQVHPQVGNFTKGSREIRFN
jgi:hypothetical protein